MKKTTCKDLQGPCDAEIVGETPEAMGENSKKHVMEIMQKGDAAHKEAVERWMQVPKEEQMKWHEEFKNNFENLPDA